MSAIAERAAPYRLRVVNEKPEAFVMVPLTILQSGLSTGAVVAYCWLQRHDGERGCFPSLAALAAEMAAGERSVRRYLEELERAGFVRSETRRGIGGGGSLPTTYLLYPTGDAPTNRPESTDEPAILAVSRGDEPAILARRTGQNVRDEPAKMAVCINVELEPENKNQLSTTSKAAGRPALKKFAAPEQPTPTVEARPTEQEPPARAKQASVTPDQPSLVGLPPDVATVLDALALSGPASVKAVTAIVAAFPAVNHALAAACCAEWCANNRRKTSAATYRNWCGREGNGAHGENRGGAGPGGTGGAARARTGDPRGPANPQHAAHAAKLDW